MNRRQVVLGALATASLGGCAMFQRNDSRDPSDGFVVQDAPVPAENMTEMLPSGDTLFVSGTVNEDTATAFETVRAANPDLKRVVFLNADGPVGSAGGFALGRAVRAAGLRTHLRNDSRVSGAAVDAFLGGTQRTFEDGAFVGALRGAADPEAHSAYVTEMTGGDGYARFAGQFGGRRRPKPMTIAEIGAMAVISRSEGDVLAEG